MIERHKNVLAMCCIGGTSQPLIAVLHMRHVNCQVDI
jgi:hypothetical protein